MEGQHRRDDIEFRGHSMFVWFMETGVQAVVCVLFSRHALSKLDSLLWNAGGLFWAARPRSRSRSTQ